MKDSPCIIPLALTLSCRKEAILECIAAGGVDLQQSLPGTVDPSPEMTVAPSPVAAPIANAAMTAPMEASPAKGPPRLPPLVPPSGSNQVHPAALEDGVERIGWDRPPVPVDTDAANSEVNC